MTYEGLYHWGRGELLSAEITEAQLDARLLLESVCGTGRNDLLVHGDRAVDAEKQAAYERLIAGRKKRIPLQQLTGVQEFMGLEFLVDRHVLIPRQDTEILVEEVLKNLYDGMRILDLCTGSGCILISLLHYSNDCEGVGADISPEALAVARKNARKLLGPKTCAEGESSVGKGTEDTREMGCGEECAENASVLCGREDSVGDVPAPSYGKGYPGKVPGLYNRNGAVGNAMAWRDDEGGAAGAGDRDGRISFVQGDLFEKVEGKFDIIVSNPPYIPSGVIGTLMPEVREHEPLEALDGGEDGLSFYRRIVEECRPHLCGGGMLFLEIGYDQAADVRKLMEDAGFLEINVVKDYGGLDRVVCGMRGFE